VLWLSLLGGVALMMPVIFKMNFTSHLVIAVLMGGISNPIYSLLVAYTNDFLDSADMAAASAGLLFINGLGAISGPVITGWVMGQIGPSGYFLFMALLFLALGGYAAWRMTRRRVIRSHQTAGFTPLSPNASVLAVEAAMEASNEAAPTP
jgi:MFS family permease